MKTRQGPMVVVTPAVLPAGKEQGLFLLSDIHVGAGCMDSQLLWRELQAAKHRNDRIAINGDVFDMILTRDAKRYSPSALHPRLQGRDDVVNESVQMAYEMLAPVVMNLDMVGCGNHEVSPEKHGNVDPVAVLLDRLNDLASRKNHVIAHGGYGGFLRYRHGSHRHEIFYWHGAGGGGLGSAFSEFVTKGAAVEGADAMWFGHRHVRAVGQLERLTVRPGGVTKRRQWILRTGGYLDSHGFQTPADVKKHGRRGNYAADAMLLPAGRGGVRLVLKPDGTSRVEVES